MILFFARALFADDILHCAQDVAVQEHVDLIFVVMLVHRVDDFVETGVIDQFSGRIDAVKVGTESDVLDTCFVDHIIEMRDDLVNGRVVGAFF